MKFFALLAAIVLLPAFTASAQHDPFADYDTVEATQGSPHSLFVGLYKVSQRIPSILIYYSTHARGTSPKDLQTIVDLDTSQATKYAKGILSSLGFAIKEVASQSAANIVVDSNYLSSLSLENKKRTSADLNMYGTVRHEETLQIRLIESSTSIIIGEDTWTRYYLQGYGSERLGQTKVIRSDWDDQLVGVQVSAFVADGYAYTPSELAFIIDPSSIAGNPIFDTKSMQLLPPIFSQRHWLSFTIDSLLNAKNLGSSRFVTVNNVQVLSTVSNDQLTLIISSSPMDEDEHGQHPIAAGCTLRMNEAAFRLDPEYYLMRLIDYFHRTQSPINLQW
jgi:hypothetical protein